MAKRKTHYGVSVLDLLNAGMLKPGDLLTCEPRTGEVYRGHVEADGSLVLDGRRFRSPSGAAKAVAGNSRDGWREIKANGRPLTEYRREYGLAHPPVAQPPTHRPSTPDQLMPISTQQPADIPDSPIAERLLDKLRAMGNKDFEELVGRVFVQLGYEDVNVIGRSGDGGIDIECVFRLPLAEPATKIVCQVKRHLSPVGPSVVGDLRGRWAHRADRLVLVNVGGFTSGAKEAAEEDGAKRVALIAGADLAELMVQEGMGVRREPVIRHELDETFFSPFSS